MDLAKLKTTASANASWNVVKKKLISGTEASTSTGKSLLDAFEETDFDDDPGDGAALTSSGFATPSKPTATPKKRATTKSKAKAGAEAEAEAEAEGENGVAADDEQSPTNTPKKKGAAKRKAPEPSSPIKAEDYTDAVAEDATAHEEDAATDGTPAKKKRVYKSKAKDPDAPVSKPRVKKEGKAVLTTAAATHNDGTDLANSKIKDEAISQVETEREHLSMFGDGNIDVEGPDELTEEEMYLAQKAIDEQTFA